MAEDMTYTPVQTLADARQRIAELERENAALLGTLHLVPEYIKYLAAWRAGDGRFLLFNECVTQRVAQQTADDTDAPLTLAAIEDGDE